MFTLCGCMPFPKDFCYGYASRPYCYDAFRNTNPNNSAPPKKVERSDSGSFRKMRTKWNKKRKWKSKNFPVKFFFFSCPIKVIFFLPLWLFLALMLFVFPAVDTMLSAMLLVSGLLQLFRSDHMWTINSGTFHRLCGLVITKQKYFETKPIRKVWT